jgi:hypothetical protein
VQCRFAKEYEVHYSSVVNVRNALNNCVEYVWIDESRLLRSHDIGTITARSVAVAVYLDGDYSWEKWVPVLHPVDCVSVNVINIP